MSEKMTLAWRNLKFSICLLIVSHNLLGSCVLDALLIKVKEDQYYAMIWITNFGYYILKLRHIYCENQLQCDEDVLFLLS